MFAGDSDAARSAKGLSFQHRFDVEFLGFVDSSATPSTANGSLRLVNLTLGIPIRTRLLTTVQEYERGVIMAGLVADADEAVQALHYALGGGNLATDADGVSTGIISGLLNDASGNTPSWSLTSVDWDNKEMLSRIDAVAHVQVTQAVS